MKNTKFGWKIKNSISSDVAEIDLYGDVCEETPRDWWWGTELEGDYIALEKLRQDLKAVANKRELKIHMNSGGGDADAAMAIYGILKAMQCKKTVIIDGLIASAASIIAMAADEIQVYPTSSFMIHPAKAGLCGWYSLRDCKEVISSLDATKKQMLNAYSAFNKSKSKDEIEQMVEDTTWLVGQEIVDSGFANSLIDDDEHKVEMKISNDKKTLNVNGINFDMACLGELPKSILDKQTKAEPTIQEQITTAVSNALTSFMNKNKDELSTKTANDETSAEKTAKEDIKDEKEISQEPGKENDEMEIKNVEDLKKNYPELVAQIENSAIETKKADIIASERTRIEEIEKIENAIADKELVNKAKFDKENSMTVSELSLAVLQQTSNAGSTYMSNLQKDNKDSKVDDVKTEAPKTDDIDNGKSNSAFAQALVNACIKTNGRQQDKKTK